MPGPPTLSRCLPPEGFPPAMALLHISYLLAASATAAGPNMQIAVIILMWDGRRGWGRGGACGKHCLCFTILLQRSRGGPE